MYSSRVSTPSLLAHVRMWAGQAGTVGFEGEGLVCMRNCNSKKCTNPLHLAWGAQQQNVQAYHMTTSVARGR